MEVKNNTETKGVNPWEGYSVELVQLAGVINEPFRVLRLQFEGVKDNDGKERRVD